MNKIRSILLKSLFYFLALQILNLSIDVDYLAGTAIVNYDDIDSITELVVEKMTGDNNYTSEVDDDAGDPQNKGFEKYDFEPFFTEPNIKAPVFVRSDANTPWATGIGIVNITCKGYYNITSPPPEIWQSTLLI